VPFHSYYSIKDILGYSIAICLLITIVLFEPYLLSDPENFLLANPLVTPIHIKPEWYFLWVYAILRSIPNKLGGVIALAAALLVLFILPITTSINKRGLIFYPINQLIFWILVASWIILTWIGGRPVEDPYILIGQLFTTIYFLFYISNPLITKIWDNLLKL
jgi:ubiquinol-cytochrome c reductase cytochrome b subunit